MLLLSGWLAGAGAAAAVGFVEGARAASCPIRDVAIH